MMFNSVCKWAMIVPLIAVFVLATLTGNAAYAGESAIFSCILGSRDNGITGTYYTDGRVAFDSRPAKEWEFMATGTGVTGLTVNFPSEMVMQINHSAGIDESGKLRALGRIHLDLTGSPFANSSSFNMEHDLRRSVIKASAKTDTGVVRVDIRAHVGLDAIRLDIYDEREAPGDMSIRFEDDAPSEKLFTAGNQLVLRHENPATGEGVSDVNRQWLARRTFGMCIRSDVGKGITWSDGRLTAPASRHRILYIVGISQLGGSSAFDKSITERTDEVAAMSESDFVRTHEAWWKQFWARSYFEPDDPKGRMVRYSAAFDLSRYYTACCTSERRETPARFQIDLYRYHLRQHNWLTFGICAVETYQALQGCMRTGNWDTLRSQFRFYGENLPFYRYRTTSQYGVDGAVLGYGQSTWTSNPSVNASKVTKPKTPEVADVAYNGENPAGSLFMLALMCDYVDLIGDSSFAENVMRPLAVDILRFFNQRYPRAADGRIVFEPCNAGETWEFVKNPLEIVSAFRMALPRLISVGEKRGWNDRTIDTWREMLAAAPEIPRGRLKWDESSLEDKPEVLPGNLLVPAEDMSGCRAYVLPWSQSKPHYVLNCQQTELYAIWPAKLVLRDGRSYLSARKSYDARLWQHRYNGWAIDVIEAACLGLRDEVSEWFDKHFDNTYAFPCGLAQEASPANPACPGLPEYSSLQGMGTGVIPVFEMLMQDYPDELKMLPCWPEDVPVKFAFYSPFAGKVEANYEPGKRLWVKTDRNIRVTLSVPQRVRVPVEHVIRSN
ncbi:MAG: hypothetical protein ACYC64_02010 [Armatimonadota bacterium]